MVVKPLTELTVTELWREVKDNGDELVVESSRVERMRLARELFERAMVEERRGYLGICESYERSASRTDQATSSFEEKCW